MAAPQSAYTGDLFQDANAATALIAVPDVSDTVLKSRFYLDDLLAVAEGASGGTLTKHGFIGLVIVGSTNYYMHNLNRMHTLREIINGQEAVLLNDAGLNTLGRTLAVTVGAEINIFEFEIGSVTSYAAFYINGEYGFEVSKFDISWKKYTRGNHNQNTTDLSTPYDLGADNSFPFKARDVVSIRTFHTNSEGTYYSPVLNVTAKAWAILNPKTIGITGWPSQATSVSPTLYAEDKRFRGTEAFPWGKLSFNEEGTAFIDSQLWVVTDRYWLKYTGSSPSTYTITEFGLASAGNWPTGDPANPPAPPIYTEFRYEAYGDTVYGSGYVCDITDPSEFGYLNRVTLESRPDFGRFYASPNPIDNPAPDGYYQTRRGTRRSWMKLVDGWQTETGDC